MSTTRYAKDDVKALVTLQYDDSIGSDKAIGIMNVWLARKDGIAIYRNSDLGSSRGGHIKFVSFGSEKAQLVTEISKDGVWTDPPDKLPDIGGDINWMYILIGTYQGEML